MEELGQIEPHVQYLPPAGKPGKFKKGWRRSWTPKAEAKDNGNKGRT